VTVVGYGSVLVRRVVFLTGLAFLLAAVLAACGSSAPTPTPTPSRTLGSTPVFPVPSRNFSSAALGVSFRYPVAWRAVTSGVVMKDDVATVAFRDASGEVGVVVDFIRPAKQATPFPFGGADGTDLSSRRSSTGDKVLRSGLVTMDGVRLVEIESISGASPGRARWRSVQFSSAGMGGDLTALHTSLLALYVASPVSQWSAQRATLMAALASMRFTRPKG